MESSGNHNFDQMTTCSATKNKPIPSDLMGWETYHFLSVMAFPRSSNPNAHKKTDKQKSLWDFLNDNWLYTFVNDMKEQKVEGLS